MPDELVLCLPAWKVDAIFRDGPWKPAAAVPYLGAWLAEDAEWRRRSRVEDDPEWRHVSTYAILHPPGDILAYRRGAGGSEGRLHGRLSVGVGGHVELRDMLSVAFRPTPAALWSATLDAATARELAEEVGPAWASEGICRFAGLIASDDDPVSRVHLGYVTVCRFACRPPLRPEAAMAEPRWMTQEELLPCTFESWSRIALDHLLAPPGPIGEARR